MITPQALAVLSSLVMMVFPINFFFLNLRGCKTPGKDTVFHIFCMIGNIIAFIWLIIGLVNTIVMISDPTITWM